MFVFTVCRSPLSPAFSERCRRLPTEKSEENATKCVSGVQPLCHETAASGLSENSHQSHTRTVSNSSQQISVGVCLHVEMRNADSITSVSTSPSAEGFQPGLTF